MKLTFVTGMFVLAAAVVSCGLSIVGTADDPKDVSIADGSNPNASDTSSGAIDANGETPPPPACHALQFDGSDDYVLINDAADLDPTGPSTIEAWVLLTKDTIPELHIVSHHDHFGRQGFLLMAFGYGASGGSPAELGGCTRYYDGSQMNQAGFGNQSLMSLNKWVHLAGTYDGTTIRIHVDGKERESVTGLPRHPNADFGGALHIGRNVLGDNFAWGGLIDEVRISRVARYGENDFVPSARFADTDPDTIALWHFDEGAGSTVTDVSGTHPGTIQGDAKWVRSPSCER